MATLSDPTVREGNPHSLGRKPLFQEIQRSIRSYIFERGLKSGDMLPPAPEMANYLGVSLASLREGLRAMEALGMLETRHGVGTFIRTYNLIPVFETLSYSLLFDQEGLYKMTQIREAMEAGLISEVVATISDADITALEQLCLTTRAEGWTAEYDRPFHRQIYQCLNNELIAQVLDLYWMACATLVDSSFFTAEDRRDNWHDHYRIVVALRKRDVEAAVASIHRHFARAKARMRPGIDTGISPELDQTPSR